jgi:hypothetical protein
MPEITTTEDRVAQWVASCRNPAHPADKRAPAVRFRAALQDMRAAGYDLPLAVIQGVRLRLGESA